MLHIGKEIRHKAKERNITVTKMASVLSCSRANVYKIFRRSYIDTESLDRISMLLDFDFFSLYSEDLKRRKGNQD